jgi:hypothetical protein
LDPLAHWEILNMKITVCSHAYSVDYDSYQVIRTPPWVDGWQCEDSQLALYLDSDLCDAGVIGGDLHIAFHGDEVRIVVDYWAPTVSSQLLTLLRDYTHGQMTDGIGECGFEISSGTERVMVIPETDMPLTVECYDDGKLVPLPSKIAIAARDGYLETLQIEIHASPERINDLHGGYSPLHLAIQSGNTAIVELLLTCNANPNQLDPLGDSPLQLCALSNRMDDDASSRIARMLLNNHADATYVSPTGNTAKEYAMNRKKQKLVDLLDSGSLRS